MTGRVFVDIDTQFDFMDPRGKLYVAGAETLEPNLRKLTRCAIENAIPLVATLDTHVPGDPEFERFPPHCVRGTAGFEKVPATMVEGMRLLHYEDHPLVLDLNPEFPGFMKPGFSAFTNPLFGFYMERFRAAEVVVYGVATDYCVRTTSLGLAKAGFSVAVVEDAVKPVTEAGGRAAHDEFASAGIRLLRTDEVAR